MKFDFDQRKKETLSSEKLRKEFVVFDTAHYMLCVCHCIRCYVCSFRILWLSCATVSSMGNCKQDV